MVEPLFVFFTKESVGNMIQFDYLLKWVAQPPPFPFLVWQGHILLYGTLVLLIFVDGEKKSGKADQLREGIVDILRFTIRSFDTSEISGEASTVVTPPPCMSLICFQISAWASSAIPA